MLENVVSRLEELIEMEANILNELETDISFETINNRWGAIARTHLEQGFMAWQRAIKEASDGK